MLTEARISDLLQPYSPDEELSTTFLHGVQAYVSLLLRWNARTNLTAVREPEDLVRRQVGESLVAARFVPDEGTLLDFGSGAGFPGIPLQLVRPRLRVLLAESQGKKAAFLREAVRTLSLQSEIWAGRVEDLPRQRLFDFVTMRAVDATEEMLPLAEARVSASGSLLRYAAADAAIDRQGWRVRRQADLPGSGGRLLQLSRS